MVTRPGRETFALILLMAALPLGSAPLELATGLVLIAALARRLGGGSAGEAELAGPLALVALVGLASALGQGGLGPSALRAALEPAWAAVLVIALPLLAPEEAARERATRVGLAVAAAVGVASLALAWPLEGPGRGPFSHHLTLGYALIPPLAVALERRAWAPALGITAGVLAAKSSGPALAAAVVAAGLLLGPGRALVGGALLAVGLVAALRADPALVERAVLWTSGAELALHRPLGTGEAGFRAAVAPVQEALAPSFHFPLHAHDAALQRAATGGFAAWVAWGWLLLALWRRAGPGGRAGLAGLLVGGLTQDTLGDLEVLRAATAWALVAGAWGTGDRR